MDASSFSSSADNQDVSSESGFDGYFSGGHGAYEDQQVFWSEQDDIEVVQDQQNFDDEGAYQQQAFGVPYDNEGLDHELDHPESLDEQLNDTTAQPDAEDKLMLAASVNSDDFKPYGTLKPLLLKRADWKGWNKPLTPIARRLCYIVPEDAEGEPYRLPDRNINWMESGGRQCAEWARDNIDLNDVIEKLENAPLVSRTQDRKKGKGTRAGEKRTKEDKWKNTWSMRAGRWLQDQGGLAVLKVGASRDDDIPEKYVEGLLHLPTANFFHGVNAVVEPGSFQMYPSADYHHGIAADPSTKYPLPAPKDVLPSIRRALLKKGRDLGTFIDFLRRNPDRFDHYNLDPETGKKLVDGNEEEPEAVEEKKTTRAMKAAKTIAKNKTVNPEVTRESNSHNTLEQSLPQPQQNLRSRKRSFDDEDSMGASKKQRTDGKTQQLGAGLVSPISPGTSEETAWDTLLTRMKVEDTSLLRYNVPIQQYHSAPSPYSTYNDQGEHFVDAHQQYGRSGSTPTPDSGSGYDAGYGSSLSPNIPENLDDYIAPIIQLPRANDMVENYPVHRSPIVELPNTAAVGGQGVCWNGEGSQMSTPESSIFLDLGDLSVPVQQWFDESEQTRDQELSFGAESELDVVMGYDW
ncbi:hypothetical protein EG328_006759 [Venturia inaequalis]|uniref:Uncharacterized protein n=1 Tax=Venturia inaequalis TaxID=5025 RepID=A0A8H3VBI7_VENIN|nr:hypothetical protein EG328_006759 [Venturia inaequalis]KAE9992064.1 hypothetical protein EG327_010276 [Venturia inaequalis]